MVTSSPPTTVLVADDDVGVRTALGRLISRRHGLVVVDSVADGAAAADAAEHHRPTVAIVDVRMPRGGAEAVRLIRHASPLTAIVVYTAYVDTVTEHEVRAAGASVYAVKGDRHTDIIAAIETAATAPSDDLGRHDSPGDTS
jgi:DNA-binding NarL/FixJ family response regulator